ncbi:MAG: glycosyltransferase [Pirellulaceae bacterium]|nr:glycosyltransferase [Pirellulaceae bacterium]
MNRISVVTPCFNEEENVEELHRRVREAMDLVEDCDYEHIFIDNASTDRTAAVLRELAARDQRVKVILNARNFGHIRSPHHAICLAQGDAVIPIVADLQDPPDLIPTFIEKWREGYKLVLGVKANSDETPLFFLLRRIYYRVVNRLSDTPLVEGFHGFGIYDRQVIDLFRQVNDPYPYARGLISEFGFEPFRVTYHQKARRRGITKNNFYTLYDMAMLGLTSHSKVPLRLATIFGFSMSLFFLLVGFGYFVAKLVFWQQFSLGIAPLVVGMFLFASVQLFFIGILGEYIGAIHTQVLRRPLVVEKERINFDAIPSPRARDRQVDLELPANDPLKPESMLLNAVAEGVR